VFDSATSNSFYEPQKSVALTKTNNFMDSYSD
jgi:hypothetical protein